LNFTSDITQPNLLILNKPTNGLDPEDINKLRDLLTKLTKDEQMGILISSHNLAELESFCNKVTIIQNGEVIESSTLENAKKVEGRTLYEIELDNTKDLNKIIDKELNIVDDDVVKIYMSKEEVPEIIAKLVVNKRKVYKVYEDL